MLKLILALVDLPLRDGVLVLLLVTLQRDLPLLLIQLELPRRCGVHPMLELILALVDLPLRDGVLVLLLGALQRDLHRRDGVLVLADQLLPL
jgi:hypothetical protein